MRYLFPASSSYDQLAEAIKNRPEKGGSLRGEEGRPRVSSSPPKAKATPQGGFAFGGQTLSREAATLFAIDFYKPTVYTVRASTYSL
jgi:hypothetical protein